MEYTLGEIAEITHGQLLQGSSASRVHKVTIDSRKNVAKSLFCAIKGEKSDAHDFIGHVVAKGGVGALIQRQVKVNDPSFGLILVDSTINALGALASFHRRSTTATVIGITGSLGKTSTKDLIGNVLNQKFETYKNPGNLNSHIGLPLAMLGMGPNYDYAVFEMAMRARGEIKELCNIAKPTIGVLTDISASHIGVLGSLKQIAIAKRELLESLPPEGLAVLCWDNALIKKASEHAKCDKITYGFDEHADCRAFDVIISRNGFSQFKIDYNGNQFDFKLNMPGIHQVQNASAAIALGFKLGLSSEEISKGLLESSASPMRQEVIHTKHFTIINDAYNASVKSMQSALDLLSFLGQNRKIAILGEIREMGKHGPKAHLNVGRYAGKKADILVTIGNLSKYTKQGWDETKSSKHTSSFWFPDKEASVDLLRQLIKTGDTCLVKASRGLEFEWLIEFLLTLSVCSVGDEPC